MIPGEAHILNTSTNVEWLSNRHRTYFVDRYSIHSCISSKYVSGYCLLYSSWVKCHLLVGHKKGSMINWYGILFVRLPVSQGFRPPPWYRPPPRDIAPPGPNPKGSRPPCAPPFRDLAPPRPNDTFQRIFLYLDLATKNASEIWFGNLFDNGFARVRLRANAVWYFRKLTS